MKLHLQNFGPIQEATIDLTKKIYVFVGYNNSGKTYLSQLIWSIFSEDTLQRFTKSVTTLGKPTQEMQLTPTLLDAVTHQFAEFILQEVLPEVFNDSRKEFIGNHQLQLNFRYTIEALIPLEVDLHYPALASEGGLIRMVKPKGSEVIRAEHGIPTAVQWVDCITRLLFHQTVGQTPLFLPANRIFFPAFYKYLFQLEREDKQRMETEMSRLFRLLQSDTEELQQAMKTLMEAFQSPYTAPTNVLFKKMYELNTHSVPKNHYRDLMLILHELLGGDIVMRTVEGLGIVEFRLKLHKQSRDLPMFLASSSANQLTTLYLYLKYWAEKQNNFLMIDEPEENLHPGNQVKLSNLLIRFATEHQNRVLINTHSPLMVENINNYVYLNILRERIGQDVKDIIRQNGLRLDPDIRLKREDLGVYFFKRGKVTNLDNESTDFGIHFRDFYRVSRELSNTGKILTDYIDFADDEEDIFD
ncbi:AAA family ATPase [Microscilla marina]|uniref:Endonuclease GajA/Old nuclease/RecF-like AAA domain-containing protein n=1 Tax=Microscilla marina ATCC 23134 TaxID=313606 RepID=A1ZLY8_MICM2|nr:AAA family ATPase [Microscilla marina]EAY28521.1 conserved hypothetical protein [Microscilla marina ATCC 23134]